MPNLDEVRAVNFAFSQVGALEKSTAEEVDNETLKAFGDLVRQARKLRFWNQRLASLPEDFTMDDLASLVPALTRSELQESSGELRLRLPGTSRPQYYLSSTSGSTGQPVEVMKFGPSQRIQSAVLSLLRAKWAGLDVKKNYARIRNSREVSSKASWGFPYSMLGKTGSAYILNANSRGVNGALEALVENEISYIHGNTTVLKALALEYKDSHLNGKLKLEKAMTWAEKVTQDDRDLILEHLGVEIWDSYSSEELGSIALQCPESQHLHVLPFFTHVEIVDEEGKPCTTGQPGRVLATSLHNYAQPLIRYELGDLASFQEPCPVLPNFPVINPEVTRLRDEYISKSGAKMFPGFGKSRFMDYQGIRDFQVILFTNRILFMFVSSATITPQQQLEIAEDVGKQFNFDLPVELLRVNQDQMQSHWKRKIFYRSSEEVPQIQDFSPLDLTNLS